jgi:HEAT repeat protein
LGRDSIIKLLQVLLTQDDVNIRKNAIYAIDNFQGPDVLKLLAIALKDKSEYIRMEVLNLLGRRSEPAVEMLISQATSDPNLSVKQLAATLLKTKHSRNQSPAHRIQLSGMVDTLDPDEPLPDLSVLQGCDVAFQVATLKKVAEQFTDDAYEYVCQLLETSTDTELTVHSIKALAAIGGQSDFHRLRDFLDSSNDVIKMAAIEGVSQIASPQDLLTYVTPQLRSESAAVKDVAMRNLMRFKPQILLGHFNRLLQAKNLSVKIIGIYALSCFSGDTVQKLLMSVSTVNHPDIRFNLARALKNRKEDWSLQLLSKMAVDSDNRVALAAQSSLAHLRGDKAAKIKDSPASPPPSPSVNVPHSVETGVPSSAISPSSFGGSLFSQGQSYKDGDSGIGAAIERAARPVSAIGDIANLKEAQAEQISEDDMLSKSFVGNLANLVSTSPTMSTLFGKLSDKKSSAMKELSELDKKQRAIFETMGRKVYDLCEKKVIDEPEFTKAVFVVQKHLKLQKEQKEQKGQKADTSGGFLLSLLGGDSSTSTSGSNVALKQQFVYLGKTAYRLRQNGGLQIPELSESYLDIQALEERISQLMKEG